MLENTVRKLLSVPRMGVFGSRIMSFGMSPISTWSSRFVPRKMARTVSRGFNKVVSKVIPQDQDTLYALAQEPIYQVLILSSPEETAKIEKEFPHLKFTRSSPFAADVLNPGISKLEGIRIVGQGFGFDIDEVMAFGDSDNDLEDAFRCWLVYCDGKWDDKC